jgi:sugar lactone lactonase YvrE
MRQVFRNSVKHYKKFRSATDRPRKHFSLIFIQIQKFMRNKPAWPAIVFALAAAFSAAAQTPPSVVGPTNQIKLVSSNATFKVTASGTTPIYYQWCFNNTNLLANATNASLALTNVQLTNAGSYSLIVSNSAGSVTSAPAILLVNPPLAVFTIAGQAMVTGYKDSLGTNAWFNVIGGVAADNSGNIYVSDYFNNMIRKISPSYNVTTSAGSSGFGTTDGQGSAARFFNPRGLSADNSGNIYVADFNGCTIRRIAPDGAVKTLAGLGMVVGSADGSNSVARFFNPRDVVVDKNTGILYVTDNHNNTIRKISPAGTNWVVTTIAGQAGIAGSTDGTGINATFNQPSGIDMDSAGNLYVADFGSHIIRELSPSGTNWTVSTIAGRAGNFGNADGIGSNASFNFCSGIAVDGSGNVYVGDGTASGGPFGHGFIRKMTLIGTNWFVGTVAGSTSGSNSSDGIGAAAGFDNPADIRLDLSGHLFIGDRDNSTVREGVIYNGQPIIAFPPQSLAGYAGTNVVFSVNVMGTMPFYYQWELNGANLVDGPNISGSQSNVLTISSVLLTNIGNYQLIISNAYGCVTSIVANQSIVLPPMKPLLSQFPGMTGFSWLANSNLTYQVQYTTNLSQPDWINLGASFSTNGNAAVVVDSVTNDLQRYYRIQLVQ